MFIKDPTNLLATFEDVIDAFKQFPDGGFWVKKIIQRMGVFRESVIGPYNKTDADQLAKKWRKIFKFEGKEVANVLQFKDLICSSSPKELGENTWKPPKGSGLLCVLYNYYPMIIYDPVDVEENPDYLKFYRYVRPEGIRSIRIRDKMIIYNQNSVDSQRRKYAMCRLLDYYTDSYDNERMEWLIRKITGRNVDDLEKPTIVPGYIERLDWECSPVELEFFKEKTTIQKAFNKLKKCAPENNKTFFFYQDIRFESTEVDLIYRTELEKILKRLVIEKGDNGKFNLQLTNYEGNFSVGIYAIENNVGRMIIHLPNSDYSPLPKSQSIFISKNLRKNRYFTKMDVTGAILLYIAKCLGIKKVWLEDDKTEDCGCGAINVASFINPIRFLAGEPSIYGNLGFQNVDQNKIEQIIDQYRQQEIPIIEDGEVVNLFDLATMYLKKDCIYENVCDMMSIVTEDIYKHVSNKYELNLDRMSLEYYRGLF